MTSGSRSRRRTAVEQDDQVVQSGGRHDARKQREQPAQPPPAPSQKQSATSRLPASAAAAAGAAAEAAQQAFNWTYERLQREASWCAFNEFVLRYYRPAPMSPSIALKSVLRWHNETINIWTHLVPGVLTLLATPILMRTVWAGAHPLEMLLVTVFLLSNALCFLLSASYHTFYQCSSTACTRCVILDFSGITLLVLGSYLPAVYYSFTCYPTLKMVYIGLPLAFGLSSLVVDLLELDICRFYMLRVVLWCCTAGSGIVPALHILMLTDTPVVTLNIALLLMMYASYGVGMVFLLKRIPEKWWPGVFDALGSSHQIWHCAVILGSFVHFFNVSLGRAALKTYQCQGVFH